jgi:hypothetical protein
MRGLINLSLHLSLYLSLFYQRYTYSGIGYRGRLSERLGERLLQPLMWLKRFVYKGFKGIE